jgi:hypothetical protein
MSDVNIPMMRESFEEVAKKMFYSLEPSNIDDRWVAVANAVIGHMTVRKLIVKAISLAYEKQAAETDPAHKREWAILITDLHKCEAWLGFKLCGGDN